MYMYVYIFVYVYIYDSWTYFKREPGNYCLEVIIQALTESKFISCLQTVG